MYPSAYCRWVPALVLFVALPAAPPGKGVLGAGHSEDENPACTQTPDGNSTVGPARAPPLLTLEESGDLHFAREEYQAAIQAYAQIAQPSAHVLNMMGISYQMLYDLKDAERYYKKSLKLEPDNPSALNNLATVQELLHDFPGAECTYRKALKFDPHSAVILKNLGTNLLMQRDYEKGNEAYNKALAIDPNILDDHPGPQVDEVGLFKSVGAVNYMKARACSRAGLTDCAIAYLRKAFYEGAATVKQVNADDAFANLRGTPAFARLLAQEQ
jgi:tetratricopeptide (TPR) repeat protein